MRLHCILRVPNLTAVGTLRASTASANALRGRPPAAARGHSLPPRSPSWRDTVHAVQAGPNASGGKQAAGGARRAKRVYLGKQQGDANNTHELGHTPQQPPREQRSLSDVARNEEPSSVDVDDGEYPTAVARDASVTDGKWDAADERQVKSAQRDAARLQEKLSAPAKGEPGSLLSLSQKEMEALAETYGQPKYRGKQLYDGVYKHGKRDVADIDQVPKAFREMLAEANVNVGRSEVFHIVEANDGTVKMLLKLADNRVVETVGIPAPGATKPRLTVCVSSQVGCPMRCTFCATGKGGFARNLEPHEIADQVLSIQEHFGQRVSNIVFMGMGEPMLNIPSVLASHRTLNEDLGIGARNITISTVGVPNALRKLADHNLQSTLAVSLHAPNQGIRASIVPSAKVYPFDALLDDCHDYFQRTKRRVTFEYTLLSGVNDLPEHATQLAKALKKHHCAAHVNLIPWNPVDDASEFDRPSKKRINEFKKKLEAAGIATSVRETRGLEAAAACGQLRNNFQKNALTEEDDLSPFQTSLA